MNNSQEPGGRLWIRMIKKHRVAKSAVIPCTRDNPQEALRQALPSLDVSQPLWLKRHQTDWDDYALTRFMPDHFLEHIPYDSVEISYIYDEGEAKPQRRRSPAEEA